MADGNGNGAGTALVQREQGQAVSPFQGDAEAWNTAQRIARALSSSSVVPEAYRGQAGLANTLVAMEYANRLGASVLAVMQNLDVIHGRPSLRASFLIGAVNATRRFTPIRYRWQGSEGKDDWGCRAIAKDRETGEECIGPLITIALAKAEGWSTKQGSKWKTIPELMLMYRAGAWWSRVFCPELSLGLHTSNEAEDFDGPPSARIEGAAAALDAGDQPVSEDEDRSPATVAQIDQIKSLRAKAREAGLLESADEEFIQAGIAQADIDGFVCRSWIVTLQKRLAGEQAGLGV
jgi:hypothetical protein